MKGDENQGSDEKENQKQEGSTHPEGNITDESSESGNGKVRRRIRVRKRLRVRKKPSIKKKLKKIGEKVFWVVIVVGFVAALIVMMIELDIRDEKFKQKKKATPTRITF